MLVLSAQRHDKTLKLTHPATSGMASAQGPPGEPSSTAAASSVATSPAAASSRRCSTRHRRSAAACLRELSPRPLPAGRAALG